MGLFSKKADPIASKARELEEQIAAVQLQIKKLNRKLDKDPEPAEPAAKTNGHAHQHEHPLQYLNSQSPVRSTVTPHGPRLAQIRNVPREPIFESVDHGAPPAQSDPSKTHFNDLGVRKYDLPAAWRRLIGYFRGPATHNPKLVSYLAAGSIRGLRPLRYEKRVARNRFLLMSGFFVVVLYWLTAVFWRHR
jgi:hypothetical protein